MLQLKQDWVERDDEEHVEEHSHGSAIGTGSMSKSRKLRSNSMIGLGAENVPIRGSENNLL